jgi:RimJ/RimL family protein N-acetyltransferase
MVASAAGATKSGQPQANFNSLPEETRWRPALRVFFFAIGTLAGELFRRRKMLSLWVFVTIFAGCFMTLSARPAPDIPLIETQRLRLRGHRASDLEAAIAMWDEPEVLLYTIGKKQTREEVWARLLRHVGHWSVMGYGIWAVEEKASDRYIGDMGFANFEREFAPSLGDTPENGWALRSQFHGKGYASEALSAIVEWGDRHFGPLRTVCLIQPDNAASIRLAQKFGYREYARSTYREKRVVLFERLPQPNH